MKKIIVTIMAVIMCVAFAACGSESTGSDQDAEFDIATAEDSPEWVAGLEQAKGRAT